MSSYSSGIRVDAVPYKRWSQLNLRTALIGLTLTTLIIGVVTVGLSTTALLLLFELTFVLVSVEFLTRNLPTAIQKAYQQNAIRADGSRSQRRANVERKSRTRLRLHLWLMVALCLTPGNVLLVGIDTFVVPVSIGFDAMASFRASPTEWKDQLRASGVESRFDTWHSRHGYRQVQSSQMKRTLWHSWPVIVVVVFTWITICWLALKHSYLSALQSYAGEINRRADHYMAVDVARYHDAAAMPVE